MTVSETKGEAGSVMATGDTLRRLLSAHARRDDEEFRGAALELAENERRNNHRILADDLERLALSARRLPNGSLETRAPDRSLQIPRDRERGLALLVQENPDVSWHRLVLPTAQTTRLERLIEEHRHSDLLARAGLAPTRRVLLVGPPGTGKTLTARVLASTLGIPLFVVRFDAIVSSLLGETAANLAKIFEFLKSQRGVVLFDEFDAVAKERADESEHGELKRVVAALLQLVDAYTGQSMLVAASNHEGLLDAAVWRRFEFVMRFAPPSNQDRVLILRRMLAGAKFDDAAVLRIARKTAGATGSDLEAIATFAARTAAMSRLPISAGMLEEALAQRADRRSIEAPVS
jgi:SpoVK/Ycf46/Vps4 family AAA+-type ATPase